MTYVEQQTSAELRQHMRRLKKMHGWHEPLADRLFRKVETQDAEIERLKEAARDARLALDLALLADGLSSDIKNRLRTAWLKLGDALS